MTTSSTVLPKAVLLSLLTALAIALLSGGTPAQAAACDVDSVHYPSSKGGYFLSLRVTKISCRTGKSLMKSHYACRVRHGIKGTCSAVRGYHCTEKRGAAIPTEFNATVTCKSGTKRFVYAYQQNT
jgi:hypothetical protein